jgi:regulator of sigma D
MKNHLNFVSLFSYNMSKEPAVLNDLKYFLEEEKEVDYQIREAFPLNAYGSPDDWFRIEGSKDLIRCFESINDKKWDIPEKLINIKLLGFNNVKQIVLRFDNDEIDATGIYDFTNTFFDVLFSMRKFARYCLEHGYKDIVEDNIKDLLIRNGSVEKQFRLIEHKGNCYIRGLTSMKYNNYDNHIAIYITMLEIHKMAIEEGCQFRIDRAYLSDSEINIFIEQKNPLIIAGFGKVYFGALLSNSEIREGTLSLVFRYRVENEEKESFGGMPDIEEAIFSIKHDTTIRNVKNQLEKLKKLSEWKAKMYDHIKKVGQTPHLSEDRIYAIFKSIQKSTQKLGSETRERAKSLEDSMVSNTYHIIKFYNRLYEITTDVDERIALERIFYKSLKDMGKTTKFR